MNQINYYILGKPSIEDLTEVEKRILLCPLFEVIRAEVRSEEGQKKFQAWKVEYFARRDKKGELCNAI